MRASAQKPAPKPTLTFQQGVSNPRRGLPETTYLSRRHLVPLCGLAPLLWRHAALAQPRSTAGPYRIGTLSQREIVDENSREGAALTRALTKLGYQLQRDYSFVGRKSDFGANDFPRLVQELV